MYSVMRLAWLPVLLAAGLVGTPARAADSAEFTVAVSIPPLGYFVERIAGERVTPLVVVEAGQSPHSYNPTPKEVAALSKARVFFRVGVGFEESLVPRVERIFPAMKIVDLRKGIPLRMMGGHEQCTHEGHDHDHHHHGGRPDPHSWLSPECAKIQARTICDTLSELDPPKRELYERNLKTFIEDLERVDERIAAALKPYAGREVFVFHPAFGYFLEEYGLVQVPVEIEGKEPTARQLATLIERARSAGVRIIFVQPQFSTKSAEAVADAIGGVVMPLDPLAADYLDNLQAMARKLEAKFSEKC
jgi:zinc transport system substrate-binding protein